MKEPPLVELKGNSRLALGFFNSLIRRIECTKPVAGNDISIQQADNGFIVNSKVTTATLNLKTITLNVCSNGNPETIQVYAP